MESIFVDIISGDKFFSNEFPHDIIMDYACIEARGENITKIKDRFKLNEVLDFSRADFMTWAKIYLKKLIAELTESGNLERIPAFKRGATELIKLIAGNFDEM